MKHAWCLLNPFSKSSGLHVHDCNHWRLTIFRGKLCSRIHHDTCTMFEVALGDDDRWMGARWKHWGSTGCSAKLNFGEDVSSFSCHGCSKGWIDLLEVLCKLFSSILYKVDPVYKPLVHFCLVPPVGYDPSKAVHGLEFWRRLDWYDHWTWSWKELLPKPDPSIYAHVHAHVLAVIQLCILHQCTQVWKQIGL